MPMKMTIILLLACAMLNFSPTIHALETDQFYTWGKPIEDSTEYLNAWVQLRIQSVLDTRVADSPMDCEAVVKKVQASLQNSLYHPMDLWISSSKLVDRIPRGLEESREYRARYLMTKLYRLDTARLLEPSATVEVNNIRIGADKLAHFFSQGWWYYKKWKKNRDDYTQDELQRFLVEYGINLELGALGAKLTGVTSPGDLEANYQGFLFYRQLCHGDEPLLYRQEGRWQFPDTFDFRDYVSPGWDESWNPNIYHKRRWKKIRPAMLTYCPLLHSPWVKQQRKFYRELETQTLTAQIVKEWVADGKLPDPQTFAITTVCQDGQNQN